MAVGAMVASPLVATAQASPQPAPGDFEILATDENPAFELIGTDLEFILEQIQISEAHAHAFVTGDSGYSLLCDSTADTTGKCVRDPQLPHGLRTVDGSFNNLEFNTDWGKSNELMPRLLPIEWADADAEPDPMPAFWRGNDNGENTVCEDGGTCYEQTAGFVYDSDPRTISNLIVDSTTSNPAAVDAAADNLDSVTDPDTGEVYLPNVRPDEGLSAPVNMWFVFFGQFFDHGLDLVEKGGNGQIVVPLAEDDPLWQAPRPGQDGVPGTADDINMNFMTLDRATNLPGPDGTLGTADDVREHSNRTTPFVDQNQTYTSHPAHQVFIREYKLVNGRPVDTGRLLNGANGGLATWGDVKRQAREKLGIELTDLDVLDIPQIAVDLYGNFVPDTETGFPQLITESGAISGSPQAPVATTDAMRLDQSFLDDIAHGAVPNAPAGYDNVALEAHFITGDGRGNENIGLTAVHHVFHAEHNRLFDHIVNEVFVQNPDVRAAYEDTSEADDWSFEQRVFQAARFANEMQYQHLVFEEFARTVQPSIDAVVFNENAYDSTIDPSIKAEFAHVVYRFGHSMLTQELAREGFGAQPASLLDAFLNPVSFHCKVAPVREEVDGVAVSVCPDPATNLMTPEEAAGSIINGATNQAANQIDELVTSTLRNSLLGLPLDLAAINIMRGRDVGVPPLQEARREFYAESGNPNLRPYNDWEDFGLALRNGNNFGRGDSTASLVNFIAAYGTHPSVADEPTMAGKRAAAEALVNGEVTTDIITRLSGTDRYATAATVSRSAFPGEAPVVYIANGRMFPDALAGGPAAAAEGGPTLMVGQNSIPAATALEIFRLKPAEIVVLGGSAAVSDQVFNSLQSYTAGPVTRVAGGDRYDTAARISERLVPAAEVPAEGVEAVYLATGANFPDALAGAAVAARDGAPLLLTQPTSIPDATLGALNTLRPQRIVLLGGDATISLAVQESLEATFSTATVKRLVGSDRYQTALAISEAEFSTATTVYVSVGTRFPDALTASAVAGPQGAPILLVPDASAALPPGVGAEIQRLDPSRIIVLGGENAVTTDVEQAVSDLFPAPAVPGDRRDFLRSEGAWANVDGETVTGLEEVDFWVGGLAEALDPFGGMLGSTFNYVFEQQLEDLQFGDRFYYLFRNQGNQLFAGLEANSFSSLIQRNTDASLLPADIFASHDPFIDLENLPSPLPAGLIQQADGTWRWDGDEHIEIHGNRTLADRIRGGQGDDALWGYGGHDRIEGGSGDDSILGGPGNDILTDAFGDDNIKGGDGHDAIDGGPGIDLLLSQGGNDYVSKSADNADGASAFLGTDNDVFVGGTGRDNPFGNEGDDWMEGGPHADLLMGDNGQQFQNDVNGGHDVLVGGAGSDDMDAEGGDDIMIGTPGGTDRFHGMFGYDFVTYHGMNTGVDADLNFNLLQPPDVTAIRDRFLQVESLSGGGGDDVIRGLGVAPDDLDADAVNKMTEEGIDRIGGLEEILRPSAAELDYALRILADNPLLQDNDGVSNLLFGGAGDDVMEGRFGDDFIDGDAALRVRLRVGETYYDSAAQLKTGIFNGTIVPGDIEIVRDIVVAEGAENNVDTAVYFDPFLNEETGDPNYTVTHLHDNYYEIVHIGGAEFEESEGQDIIRNIEMLQFGDGACFSIAPGASDGDVEMMPCPNMGYVTFEGQIDPPTEDEKLVATVHFEQDGVETVANPTGIRFNWQAGEVGEAWDPSPTGDNLPDAPNGRVDTFTPGDGDATAILRVVVTFTDDNGQLRQIVSDALPEVVNVNDEPTGLTLSTMAPSVGSAITPSPFEDADGLEEAVEAGMSYEWQSSADGFTNDIEVVETKVTPGTFLLGYTVSPEDEGRQIRVVVTYTDDKGQVETYESPATAAVTP